MTLERARRVSGSIRDLCPTAVRIVFGNRFRRFGGVVSQVFLIDDAVLINDKGHDATDLVLRGIGDESHTAFQHAVH